MPENVFSVRIETGDKDETYHYLVGIECGLHQLTKHDSAQKFAESAFRAKHTPGRKMTVYWPELYEGDSLPDLPKLDQGCDCWAAEI